MSELNLNITTPAKNIFTGEIKSITLPGTLGGFQILKNHAPIISTLEIGVVKIVLADNSIQNYATGGGTVEVSDNKILLLADSIERSDEIEVDRAKTAMERARKRLDKKGEDKSIDAVRAEAALARAMNRIKIVEKFGS